LAEERCKFIIEKNQMGITGLLLIAVNVAMSYKGLKDRSFFDTYQFEVDKILLNRDYKRIITGGFLHASWMHLFFNMLSLFFFSGPLESMAGPLRFIIIYFVSLTGGHLLALFIHRNHGAYTSIGASGAVNGIIFAAIALLPGMTIGLFFIPIPGWVYGLVFIIFSIYGIKSKKNNIGHEAHLGGAIMGMLTVILFYPSAFKENYVVILLLALPSIAFIALIAAKPHLLLIEGFSRKKDQDYYSIDHRYNKEKIDMQKQVDRILDKIAAKGMNSLTQKEKDILKQYSKSPPL
jgi:membrane associated rhomboid family serine protease